VDLTDKHRVILEMLMMENGKGSMAEVLGISGSGGIVVLVWVAGDESGNGMGTNGNLWAWALEGLENELCGTFVRYPRESNLHSYTLADAKRLSSCGEPILPLGKYTYYPTKPNNEATVAMMNCL
jgi:hypothetical protein